MKTKEDLAALVDRIPRLDKRGTFAGPRWPVAEEIFEGILEGGAENVAGLVKMLKEVDNGEDYKARYVIHGIAVYLGRPGKEKQREMFATALASRIGGADPVPVQGFVIRQIQVVGGKEVAGALGKALGNEALCDDAASALLAIQAGAVEQFRKALPEAKGRARLAVLQALGVLRDPESAKAFQEAAGDGKRDIRLTALWALARLGDAESVGTLLKASDAKSGWERIRATDSCFLLAENLVAAEKKKDARRIYEHLVETRTDEAEEYVRDAAREGLKTAK